jgi:hypothetical protein
MAGVKPLRKSKMNPKALRRVGVEADLERSSEFVNGSMEAASSVDLFTWWPRLLGVDDDGVEELSDKKDKKDQDKGVQPPILDGSRFSAILAPTSVSAARFRALAGCDFLPRVCAELVSTRQCRADSHSAACLAHHRAQSASDWGRNEQRRSRGYN